MGIAMMTQEHRAATNERHKAEDALEYIGWTCVKLSRDKQLNIPDQFTQMMKWCEDNIGTGRVEVEPDRIDMNDHWYSFSWYGYWNFWFRHEKNATIFVLRWSR